MPKPHTGEVRPTTDCRTELIVWRPGTTLAEHLVQDRLAGEEDAFVAWVQELAHTCAASTREDHRRFVDAVTAT